MKTLTVILLLAAGLCARGQTESNITAAELEARRAAAHERGRAMSEYLNQRIREAQELARSNRMSRPQPFGPRVVYVHTNNPVADMAELLTRRGITTDTNKIVITERGEAYVLSKTITDRHVRLYKAQGMEWILTNYTADEIITTTKTNDVRFLRAPSGMTEEEREAWKRSNVPHWYNPHEPGTTWTDCVYTVTFRPQMSPRSLPYYELIPNPSATNNQPPFPQGFDVVSGPQPPSLMFWDDGAGTNAETHGWTNRSEFVQLDFHDVGNGMLTVRFADATVDYLSPFLGGSVEWTIEMAGHPAYAGTNHINFEPQQSWGAWNVIVDLLPWQPLARLLTVRTDYGLAAPSVSEDLRGLQMKPLAVPPPWKPEYEFSLPFTGGAFEKIFLKGIPDFEAMDMSSSYIIGTGTTDETGWGQISVVTTNESFFWVTYSTNLVQ